MKSKNYLFGLLGLICLGLFLYLFLNQPSIQQINRKLEAKILDSGTSKLFKHLYAGQPISTNYPNKLQILKRQGFMVAYDETRKNPAWVAYRVGACQNLCFYGLKRPSYFQTDYATRARVKHTDYTKSGYDRGHLAPNYAISTRYGQSAQKETFLMSNIVPQKASLNRGIWRKLEQQIATEYSEDFEEVWVLTGPIYDDMIPDHFLKNGTEIPDAFFKIILDEFNGKPRLMGFLIPQKVGKKEQLHTFLVSVDAVEEQTGLDFFTDLDDQLEEKLESSVVGF